MNALKTRALTLLGIFFALSAYGQQNVSISDVPNTPNASSVLDVYSTSKGMLVPRLTTAQRLAIAAPANGLLVFDTDVNCFMFYTSVPVSWNSLCAAGVPLNGTSTVSSTIVIAPGAACANGGITILMGNDTNANGILDPTEITSTNNICNGLTGPAGAAGAVGAVGPQGPIGLTGPAGAAGAVGPQGPIGLTGPAGAAGAVGPQGPIGLTGPAGAAGAVGPQGPIGLTGPAGVAGAVGPQGPIGLTGPAGAAGAVGPQGPIGLTGPAGVAGAVGPQGPIGLTGPAGAAGAVGPQGPIGLTGPAGPTWTLTSDNFTAAGNLQIVTTLPQTVTSTNQAWLVGGNNFGTAALSYRLGTISNDHIDFVSNNLVRGRLSNLGEFFIGTTATALPGDLMNGVSNAAFPWAINGYSTQNGSGVYGLRQAGAIGTWGSIQGETDATTAANNAGVTGLGMSTGHRGVFGQKPTGGLGWGGLFLNDLGYTGFFGVASDKNVKKNIEPLTGSSALSKILAMKAYSYEYKYDFLGSGDKQYGFLAQELEEVVPEIVKEKDFSPMAARSGEVNLEGEYKIKSVSTVSIIPFLVEGMKEQQQMIDELRKEIEVLKNELNKK